METRRLTHAACGVGKRHTARRSAIRRAGVAIVGLMLLGALLIGCDGASSDAPAREKGNVVYVVNYPLQYFAERIGGEAVDVRFPAPAEGDPAFWTPDEATVRAYQDADLILLNGATYAKWAARYSLPTARTVDTSAGFRDAYIEVKESVTHSHGKGGAHSHAGTDFNTWVDPELAIRQAQSVRDALSTFWPDHAESFRANFDTLEQELVEVRDALREMTQKATAPPALIASHPVYNYAAKRFGWNLRNLHWEPDTMSDDAEWTKLEKMLTDHPALHMLWEDEPLDAIRERLEPLGVKVVVFRPCGNRPPSGDYLSEMRANVERMGAVFE